MPSAHTHARNTLALCYCAVCASQVRNAPFHRAGMSCIVHLYASEHTLVCSINYLAQWYHVFVSGLRLQPAKGEWKMTRQSLAAPWTTAVSWHATEVALAVALTPCLCCTLVW